jgi:hypothetical protein
MVELMVPSESAPQVLSNEWSVCLYVLTISDFFGNFCIPPLVTILKSVNGLPTHGTLPRLASGTKNKWQWHICEWYRNWLLVMQIDLYFRAPVFCKQVSGRFDVGGLKSYLDCCSYFQNRTLSRWNPCGRLGGGGVTPYGHVYLILVWNFFWKGVFFSLKSRSMWGTIGPQKTLKPPWPSRSRFLVALTMPEALKYFAAYVGRFAQPNA